MHVKTNLKKLVTFSTGAWATSPTSPPPGSRLSLIILLLLSSAKKELNIHNNKIKLHLTEGVSFGGHDQCPQYYGSSAVKPLSK